MLLAREQHKEKEDVFKIGYIKEFLQSHILKQIYELPASKNLYFYGGTAMRFLLGLNRLSEDLDFVCTERVDFEELGNFLTQFFAKEPLAVDYKIQKFRLTLKFRGLLSHFNMQYENSKDLYLKIEISDHLSFCKHFEPKIYQLFKFNQSLVIQSFDPSTLFATKLNAVLYRHRERRVGEQILTMKGRDIYDLFRYLSNGYTPNLHCIQDISDREDLKRKLIAVVEQTDFKLVVADVKNFMEDRQLLSFLETNGRSYLIEQIQKWG
ncbi:MAG: nucleotidyl transferase AbiEii/AbiGii toxin family protein [Candidatus Peribacteria bacterium]|nr:nucleotidyl transferase AbiEii/AbiGii toxin family protein [Candidatus Peribacteria bacterium]